MLANASSKLLLLLLNWLAGTLGYIACKQTTKKTLPPIPVV
jgi:hypothetical protein